MTVFCVAIDALVHKASTLLDFHLGMAKLGMPPVDCNPKLIEAAQVALELEGICSTWTQDHLIQDLLFRICTQLETRSNCNRTPDINGIVMADMSLTSTIVYKKIHAFTKLIHEHRGTTKAVDKAPLGSHVVVDSGATINTTPSTAIVTPSGGKTQGGKCKQVPCITQQSGRIHTSSLVGDETKPEGEVGLFDEDVEMNGPDKLSIETGIKIVQGIVPSSGNTVSEAGRPIHGCCGVEGKMAKALRSSSVPSKETSKVVGKRSKTVYLSYSEVPNMDFNNAMFHKANYYAAKGEANEEAEVASTQNKKARTGYSFPDSHTVLESTCFYLSFCFSAFSNAIAKVPGWS
ncbi:hypothetical protein BDZ94DRAFT_1311562 [Collybia nuda]|uniref:Uncharacterized protein n=1 Tax=Collybia nuda TaxID=64659 RepID=A0A9P6CFP8_9AGAR|nr:hypothetical protein BDZ94DRAFT_1311562 [Collybia nuda]